jgi:hypothetical protein
MKGTNQVNNPSDCSLIGMVHQSSIKSAETLAQIMIPIALNHAFHPRHVGLHTRGTTDHPYDLASVHVNANPCQPAEQQCV